LHQHQSSMDKLRPPFAENEPCAVYSAENGAWMNGTISRLQKATTSGASYDVTLGEQASDHKETAEAKAVAAADLRRRFPAEAAVLVYCGQQAGWVPGKVISEDAAVEAAADRASEQWWTKVNVRLFGKDGPQRQLWSYLIKFQPGYIRGLPVARGAQGPISPASGSAWTGGSAGSSAAAAAPKARDVNEAAFDNVSVKSC